jgi:hypothetical protein
MAAVEEQEYGFPVHIDADVKEALVRRSAETGVSINDVIISTLADYFEVEYVPTGRPGSGPRSTAAGVMQLRRIPLELYDKIDAERRRLPAGSKAKPRSARRVVDRVLRERLGL